MITRVAVPMLLLPLLAIALPLVYGVAWLREALSDIRLQRVAARSIRTSLRDLDRRR